VNELKVNVEKMKLSDLKPAEYNPRTISDEAFSGLGESISRFGLLAHIVWNKRTGNIVGGHQRFKQLQEMGEEETEVVVVDLDDNEEVALNITLNNPQIRGDFTKDVIEQLRVSEAQLGNSFRQLGLLDLYEFLHNKGLDKKPKEKKIAEPKEPKEPPPPPEPSSKEDKKEKHQAIIICPACRSQWKLTDNEVVFNAVVGTGTPVGAK
jgi:hypothetical protein